MKEYKKILEKKKILINEYIIKSSTLFFSEIKCIDIFKLKFHEIKTSNISLLHFTFLKFLFF